MDGALIHMLPEKKIEDKGKKDLRMQWIYFRFKVGLKESEKRKRVGHGETEKEEKQAVTEKKVGYGEKSRSWKGEKRGGG